MQKDKLISYERLETVIMRNSIRFILLIMVIGLIGGCAVAPPNRVYLKSYLGKDFMLSEENGSYKNIVFLLPSDLKDIREISNYRGVYGTLAKGINSFWSPFKNLKLIADWENNANNYNNKENILVRIRINDYALNAAKDSTACISIATSVSIFPFNEHSQFIFDGANCYGLTDVRFFSQPYMQYLKAGWNTEDYRTFVVEFRSGHSVNYSDVVDKLLGFSH